MGSDLNYTGDQTSGESSASPRARPLPRTAWPKGVSGNPKGRPRRGDALSETIRLHIEPRAMIQRVIAIADGNAPDAVKLQAISWLADHGYVRPASRHEHLVGAVEEDEPDLSSLTP